MINKLKLSSIASLVLLGLIWSQCKQPPTLLYPLLVVDVDPTQARENAERIRSEVAVEVAEGLELSLWASDTLITDPIAISADPQGGIYYTNGTRLEHSEFDIRGHRDWMTQSISFETVEDRRAFLRETFAPEKSDENKSQLEDLNGDGSHDWKDLTVEKESVWKIEDTDDDGVADRTQLYIEDFHEEISDLANGVEFFDDEVFIAVGPDLWRTKDTDGDGIADEKESIAHGFAVHIGFGAHGMSGVTVGPNGRIWWGIGDIGMNLVDQTGKRWKYPNQGVIVRCEPDGSNFEVFAAGLRNTHEFVFDQYGNLITEDNDGDHAGERERLVYVTNGSDGGWRTNWQFGKYTDPDNNSYKVWMDEKLNIPRWEGQAAYITPPIINYVNGPTGMVYNPGTALGDQWNNHFFIAEFRGSPANSPIHAFTLRPDGASFALDQTKEVVKGLLPTGLDFGSDGALYFSDWIDGWGVKEQGRLWKLDVPGAIKSDIRRETKELLQCNYSLKSNHELGQMLAYPDMRVRQNAQFELVKRGAKGINEFNRAVSQRDHQLARIHAIWGIAQAARKELSIASDLVPLLKDSDPEIQAQAAKMIGDVRYPDAGDDLISLLTHPSLRVQFFAAEALGRTANKNAVIPLIDMLIANDDKDAWLRHAGALALARIGDAESLTNLKEHASRAIRIAAVVALRRMRHVGIAEFLQDSDEYIVTEAARGINDDYSIKEALPVLANQLTGTNSKNEALVRRMINANLRVGGDENLEHLKDYALNRAAPAAMRGEALAALSTWAKPSVLDRVDGRYRGDITRDEAPVRSALEPHLTTLLDESSEPMVIAAMDASARLKVKSASTSIAELVKQSTSPDLTVAGLMALKNLSANELGAALEASLKNSNSDIRAEALAMLPESDIAEEKAEELFASVLTEGSIAEKQAALMGLAGLTSDGTVGLLKKELEKLQSGRLAPELHLDVIEASNDKNDSGLKDIINSIEAQYGGDPLAKYRSALIGGDANKGRRIFYRNEAAQCVRCHSIFEWGGDAGPGLMGVGERLSPEKILESMVLPSAVLAPGYGVVSLELNNDKIVAGVVSEEDETSITLKIGKDKIEKINKSDIKERVEIPSAMPSVEKILTPRQIRDVVAFLSGLKNES